MAPITQNRSGDGNFNHDGYYGEGELYYCVDFEKHGASNPVITEWLFEKLWLKQSSCSVSARFLRTGNTEDLPIHEQRHDVLEGNSLSNFMTRRSFLNSEDLETRIYSAVMSAQRNPSAEKAQAYHSSLPNISTWLGSLRIDETTDIDSLELQNGSPWVILARDADRQLLKRISSISGVTGFMMSRSEVRPEIAEALLEIESLQAVCFSNSRVPKEIWAILCSHPSLAYIEAERVGIDADGANQIARFPQLKELCLHEARISDHAVANLCQSNSLLKLNLLSTNVTGDFAADLSLSSVKYLDISNNPISSHAFRLLSESPELLFLISSVTDFDDQALRCFHNHPSLYSLSIMSTRCTLGGVTQMFEANQNCYVSF